MTRKRPSRRAGSRLTRIGLAGLLLGGALLVVVVALAVSRDNDHGAALAGTATADAPPLVWPDPPPAGRQAKQAPARRPQRPARPVQVEIPAIGVRARVIPLGLNPDRTLEVPEDFSETGWWTGGARPGERGPAVIAGHVDSYTGPAVFYRIRDLRPGDTVAVVRRDGTRARFAVQRSEQYPKDRFPTARVYGPTPGPTLRLITCGGDFNSSTGHYLDNTVVYATKT